MKWPQYTWLADLIFWGSCAFAIVCLLWWFFSNFRLRVPWQGKAPIQLAVPHEPKANLSGRIPLIQFRDFARDYFNWIYDSPTGLDGLDLPSGLRQAALDGTIRFWGRPNRNMFTSLTRAEPLNEIPATHWTDYDFDGVAMIIATDNFTTITRNLRNMRNANEGGFVDLHLDGETAARWLGNDAEKFRGFNARRKTPNDE